MQTGQVGLRTALSVSETYATRIRGGRCVPQAIAIAAAIFAARDLGNCKDPHESRAIRPIEEAVSKARYLVEVIERKIAAASDATGKQK